MKRYLKLILTLLMVAAASVLSAGALAASQGDPMYRQELSDTVFSFTYTPEANSEYALWIFSADGEKVTASAELSQNGIFLFSGSGSGQILRAWLTAGTEYTFSITGSGSALIEVARGTLSRCASEPRMTETGTTVGKMIAAQWDAHWYSFAESENALRCITCVPEEPGTALSLMLFDNRGCLIAQAEPLSDGSCILTAQLSARRAYRLRVFSPAGDTGYYYLSISDALNGAEAPSFVQPRYELNAGNSLDLSRISTGDVQLYSSSDPDVASVSAEGVLTAKREGSAVITAYGADASAECVVTVRFIELEELHITGSEITLRAGEEKRVGLLFTPANASDRRVVMYTDDPNIASVTENNTLVGRRAGTTVLYVRTEDERLSDSITVRVLPPIRTYRALLISEENYPANVNTVRSGSENSVNAIASMLGSSSFDSGSYRVLTLYDASHTELFDAIGSHFATATDADVSLLYITCHGFYQNGMCYLQLTDGFCISARDLERALRSVPGRIVVMLDCCGSGGAIGQGSDMLYGQFISEFSLSKYLVITSSGLDENSYRQVGQDSTNATMFALSLCDVFGWSISENRQGPIPIDADPDMNGSITFTELCAYLKQRVVWHISNSQDGEDPEKYQTVCTSPAYDPLILLNRPNRDNGLSDYDE